MSRLDCGHDVAIEVGTRLWCYYDASFGVVTVVGVEPDPWHDFVMDGSPWKSNASHGYYNAQRLACEDCGVAEITKRPDLYERVDGTYTLREPRPRLRVVE